MRIRLFGLLEAFLSVIPELLIVAGGAFAGAAASNIVASDLSERTATVVFFGVFLSLLGVGIKPACTRGLAWTQARMVAPVPPAASSAQAALQVTG